MERKLCPSIISSFIAWLDHHPWANRHLLRHQEHQFPYLVRSQKENSSHRIIARGKRYATCKDSKNNNHTINFNACYHQSLSVYLNKNESCLSGRFLTDYPWDSHQWYLYAHQSYLFITIHIFSGKVWLVLLKKISFSRVVSCLSRDLKPDSTWNLLITSGLALDIFWDFASSYDILMATINLKASSNLCCMCENYVRLN